MPRPDRPCSRVALRSALLVAIGLGLAPPSLQAQGPGPGRIDPEAVLAGRGLKKSGAVYLLPAEIQVMDKVREGEAAIKALAAQGQALQQSIVEIQQGLAVTDAELRNAQQQRANLNSERQRIMNQYFNTNVDPNVRPQFDAQYRSDLQRVDNQIANLQDLINRINTAGTVDLKRLDDRRAGLRQIEADIQQRQSAWEADFAYLKDAYQSVQLDPKVIVALKELNRTARPWVALGPTHEYPKNVQALAQSVLKDAGLELASKTATKRVGGKSTKVKIALAHLAQQGKEVAALGGQARALDAKLVRQNGPAAAATRQELAETVGRLRQKIDAVEATYLALNQDPLIASAIEQVSPNGGVIEPTDEFKNHARRLAELEKKLAP